MTKNPDKSKKAGFPAGEKMWRIVKAKREKARKVFPYTYEDIAEAVGLTTGYIRSAARRGKFDPRDLRSLSRYVCKYLNKKKHTKKRPKKGEVAVITDGRV